MGPSWSRVIGVALSRIHARMRRLSQGRGLIGLAVLLLWVAGCATPYRATGFQGGYAVFGSDDGHGLTIGFESDMPLDLQSVQPSLLRRAAEVTLEHGFTHFVVMGYDWQKSLGIVVKVPGIVGPRRRTDHTIHIQGYDHPQRELRGAIDTQQWLLDHAAPLTSSASSRHTR